MFKRIFTLTGRLALLAVVAVMAISYLAAGFDAGNTSTQAEATFLASTVTTDSGDFAAAVQRMNDAFATNWSTAEIEIADPADWLTVGRRIALALVGTGMSLQEIRDLELLSEGERIEAYLDKLLTQSRHHDYWAERFARVYVGAEDGPFIQFRRRRFRLWLSDNFAANRPYDELVRTLVTANGLPTDRPEVNFLTVTNGTNEEGQPDPIRLAARTSRAFLGLRIDCMQCHDDFLGNVSLGDDELRTGTQKDFHSLAAFYSSARFNGFQGIRSEDHPYEYQFLNTTETVTVPTAVPFATGLVPDEGSPRERLATWLTHPENKQFARATVCRIWALLFGKSVTAAVDNLPLDAELHPAIDVLASDFTAHGYDLRRLIRLIVMSRPFQLDSAADFEVTAAHEQLWSVFPLVRLRPEQVAGSVIQAARVKTIDRESSLVVQLMKFGGVNDFVERYGDIGEDEFDQDSVTITQRLIMLNGEMVSEYGEANPVLNSCSHINMFAKQDNDVIDSTYLCVLNRLPDEEERDVFANRLASAEDRIYAIEDLYWVLLNSSELTWNH